MYLMDTCALLWFLDDNGISILPIKTKYLERVQMLPMIHADPFDRLIMATALEEGMKQF